MADARERHITRIQAAKEELRKLHHDTPHRRDLIKHIHRMQKDLREYDFYRAKGVDTD